MEPWVCTPAWLTDTPGENRLAMNMTPGAVIQIIVAVTKSVATHATLGPLVDSQGTLLKFGESMSLPASQLVHRRIYCAGPGAGPAFAALGFNPVV